MIPRIAPLIADRRWRRTVSGHRLVQTATGSTVAWLAPHLAGAQHAERLVIGAPTVQFPAR